MKSEYTQIGESMSSKIKVFGVLVLVALMSSGCSYNVSKYGASIENVSSMKSMKSKINVKNVTSNNPGQASISCRAAGPVGTADKVPFATYIKDALISELKLAGKYDANSDISINGHLEKIDFNSNIGTANWKFTLKAISSNKKSIVVNSVYEFEGSFVADKACQEVAQAFSPAVQKLIHDIISNPGFSALM